MGRAHVWTVVTWALILLVAAHLRVENLEERGVWFFDEALYLANVQAYQAVVASWGQPPQQEHLTNLLPFGLSYSDAGLDWSVFTVRGKALYVLAASLLNGTQHPPSLLVTQYVNVLAGLITVPLTGLMAFAWTRDRMICAPAMALAAVSGLYVHYSRAGLPTGMNMLWWTATLWAIARAWRSDGQHPIRWRVVAGFCIGLSVTTHYATLSLLVLLGLFDTAALWWRTRPQSLALAAQPPAAYALGVIAAVAIPQSISMIQATRLDALGLSPAYTYVQDVMHQFSFFFGNYAQTQPWSYRASFTPFLLAMFESPLTTAIIATTSFVAVFRGLTRSSAVGRVVFLTGAVFFLVFMQNGATKFARAIAPLWPLLILCTAVGLHKLSVVARGKGLPPRAIAIASLILTFAILVDGALYSKQLLRASSPTTHLREATTSMPPKERILLTWRGPQFFYSVATQRRVELAANPRNALPGDWVLARGIEPPEWERRMRRWELIGSWPDTRGYSAVLQSEFGQVVPPAQSWRHWPRAEPAPDPADPVNRIRLFRVPAA